MTATPKPTHADIFRLLGELQESVEGLSDRIGRESDDGKSGTGLTGRIIRTEAQVHSHERLKQQVMGGFATAGVFLAIIWWLIRDRLSEMFGVAAG